MRFLLDLCEWIAAMNPWYFDDGWLFQRAAIIDVDFTNICSDLSSPWIIHGAVYHTFPVVTESMGLNPPVVPKKNRRKIGKPHGIQPAPMIFMDSDNITFWKLHWIPPGSSRVLKGGSAAIISAQWLEEKDRYLPGTFLQTSKNMAKSPIPCETLTSKGDVETCLTSRCDI